MYYIISLTHTNRHDKYITLWRSNNAGYCYSKEAAGLYETPKEGYHDSEDNMPIPDIDAERFFMLLPYDGELRNLIPNIKLVWESIGVKMTKYGLRKITNHKAISKNPPVTPNEKNTKNRNLKTSKGENGGTGGILKP